jgi:hypothetical protein
MGFKKTFFSLIGSTVAGTLAWLLGTGLVPAKSPIPSARANSYKNKAVTRESGTRDVDEEEKTNEVAQAARSYKKAREERSSRIQDTTPDEPLSFAPTYSYPRTPSPSTYKPSYSYPSRSYSPSHSSHRSHTSHRSHRSGR